MKAAAAAGCRWLGAVLDYDICANPGFGKYPQCAALNTPAKNAGPSDCQIWAGVIMPTRNCERYNANNPGHHYDCSVWCKSFGRDTGAPGRAPRYPPICDKYIRGRGSGNGQSCVAAPFSVKNDVPGAAPSLRYTLGFEVGFSGCLEKQVSVQNLALMALASKVKQVAALLMIVTAPQVIDAVLHPPGASINPNPYLRGKEEGFRLCDWAVKVSPVLVRRCPAPVEPVTTAPSPPAETSCTPDEPGFGSPAGLPVQGFDCFPCTLYYLEKQPYTRPESSAPTSDVRLQRVLSTKYGSLIPQGPKLPCWRMRDQKLGQPGWATPQSIFRELQQAGPGAKAMIFFKTRGNPVGHVFAGENVAMYDPATGRIEGRVKLWDPQQGWDGRSWFFNPDIVWWGIYRIQ